MSPTIPPRVPRVPGRQSTGTERSERRCAPGSPGPNEPPELAQLTDFGSVDSIFAPVFSTTPMETVHLPYDRTVPAPDRPSLPHSSTVTNAIECAPVARGIFARQDDNQEHFVVLMCNVQYRPYGYKVVTSGTRARVDVDPPLVFLPAMAMSARFIVAMHNHPSGDPYPSPEDISLTQRLVACGCILNIPLIDHMILTRRGCCLSVREHHPEIWG